MQRPLLFIQRIKAKNMGKYIESRHSIDTERRIVDVRPWSVKTQEKLSEPFNFLFLVIPMFALSYMFPVTAPLMFLLFLGAHFSVMSMKSLLPFRYPASMKGSKTAPKADGIMYFGSVRARSPYEQFKQCWLNDSDLRKHMLIMGSTGSGKSETLKGIFYNVLCWGSGFFCADGKADNTLPPDGYTMARAFGRDDDILYLNFLLGGATPQEVAASRRRRSNRINPFSNGDADTLIQMGANLLPKAEGDGKSWQEKALAVWRSVITALCYKRDKYGFTLSVGAIIDHLSVEKIQDLYVEGYNEAEGIDENWSYGYIGIKNYLDSGLPGFSVETLKKAKKLGEHAEERAQPQGMRNRGGGGAPEQNAAAFEQHGYRTGQLMPVLNLLDKTYGYIFQAPFSEIDMIDVALHNRILFLLIPSLEKSSQEAENLGKLAIACLRVMMARNLGSELEGTYDELVGSKATASNYPYVVALDELGYYFADGIAVMFAQARSLGMCMIAASQDLEKLTEGSRAAEAGAMIGNTVNKIFMKIDDAEKTYKLVENTVGKVRVAQYSGYELGVGVGGIKRDNRLNVTEEVMISYQEMQKYTEGQAIMNALGVTQRISTFYMGDWLDKLGNQSYHLNRFMQVYAPSDDDIVPFSVDLPSAKNKDKRENAMVMMAYLRGDSELSEVTTTKMLTELSQVINVMNQHQKGLGELERGIVMYEMLKAIYIDHDEKLQDIEKSAAQAEADSLDIGKEPLSAPVLEEQARGLSETLDEHGLPDPLALLRKPVEDVMAPVEETPEINVIGQQVESGAEKTLAEQQFAEIAKSIKPIPATVNDGYAATAEQETPAQVVDSATKISLEKTFGEGDYDNALDETATSSDSQDVDESFAQIVNNGKRKKTARPKWVSMAMKNANELETYPRSIDNTVVGLQDSTLFELEAIERSMGNPMPRTAAHDVQKILAAQVTPHTNAPKALSKDEDLDTYFDNLDF